MFHQCVTQPFYEDVVVLLFYGLFQLYIEVDLVECPFKVVETLQNSHRAKTPTVHKSVA